MIKIRRALISVSDKTGVLEFGKTLQALGVDVISTGGTAKALRDAGLDVTDVSDVTKFPECLDGRVKTLHPGVHAGILADRSKPDHMSQLETLGVAPIDLVVVNLYPFESAVDQGLTQREDLIEKIDIGGPTMLRAAAKNCEGVVVICDPSDYETVTRELREKGGVSLPLARDLAAKVFRHTGVYDAAIATALGGETITPPLSRFPVGLVSTASLRYGENPHQQGALYRPAGEKPMGFASLKQLQGKALSYNNYLDMHAACGVAAAFDEPTSVIVKHQIPCGVGFHENMAGAFQRALDADPVSAFGGVVALNRPLTGEAAQVMTSLFLEVIVAPQVDPEALEVLAKKKNLRVIECEPSPVPLGLEVRPVMGGWLVQTPDGSQGDDQRSVATKRKPTEVELAALEKAWVMVRHVRSNAIVFADQNGILGLGSGQTNRVDAVAHAEQRTLNNKVNGDIKVMASDAFFPFRDGIDAAAKAGISAIIQPGGSVRDEEAIAAADEHGMAMVFTGRRSFRH